MNVLVTGTAGYIGGHIARHLSRLGHTVIGLDLHLHKGYTGAEKDRHIANLAHIFPGSAGAGNLISVLRYHKVDMVVHCAGVSSVAESKENPLLYYTENVTGTINLLSAMQTAKCEKLIFSSSAAVYGMHAGACYRAGQPRQVSSAGGDGLSPYGVSKLTVERLLETLPLRSAALRYFNVGGAEFDGSAGEDRAVETHLIPNALAAAYYGTELPLSSRDACRDYVHVEDVARATVAAIDLLESSREVTHHTRNVGTGMGTSNGAMVALCQAITGREIKLKSFPARTGETDTLIADLDEGVLATRITNYHVVNTRLQWQPLYGLHDIVSSAWRWYQRKVEAQKK